VATRKAHQPPLLQLVSKLKKTVLADASDGPSLSLLAMIDAGLGRRKQAVEEAEHACDLVTFENSGVNAPIVRCNLAVVYAWNGKPDLAISTLEPLVTGPLVRICRPSRLTVIFGGTHYGTRCVMIRRSRKSLPR